jgi:hypothetical protein
VSEDRDEAGRFITGVKPGPGRPKGSRHRLSETFLEALAADFEAHGVAAIIATRTERPADYVRVIAGLLPKDMQISGHDGEPIVITWLPPQA